MRTVAQVDAEIVEAEAALRRLHGERRGAVRAHNDSIVAEFDTGKDIAEISEDRSIPYSAVQGILYRAGRTQAGRIAIRQRLSSVDAERVSA